MNIQKVFLATAEALDDEMQQRIAKHRAERGKDWVTVEEPLDPIQVVKKQGDATPVILLDCLTLWFD